MVFVLSSDRQPLDPTTMSRARRLLSRGRAAVFRTYPFTIILCDRTAADLVTHPHRLKLDPGGKTTGIAIVQEETERVVWAAELTHRSQAIADAMLARQQVRRNRRNRHTRYRPARFRNRRRPRSEEHTSELQSRGHLDCRLLLEKKKKRNVYCFLGNANADVRYLVIRQL